MSSSSRLSAVPATSYSTSNGSSPGVDSSQIGSVTLSALPPPHAVASSLVAGSHHPCRLPATQVRRDPHHHVEAHLPPPIMPLQDEVETFIVQSEAASAAAAAATTIASTTLSGGYDVETVTQLTDVERSRYICPICLLLMRDPVQTVRCGHRFCQLCVRRWCRTMPECPICKMVLEPDGQSELFLDLGMKREILDLSVYCNNSKTGCNRGHMTLGELQGHLVTCPGAKQPCELCGERILKSEMLQHRNRQCLAAVTECFFRPFGCKHESERRHADQHLTEAVQEHLRLVAIQLLTLQQTRNQCEDNSLATALHRNHQQQQHLQGGLTTSTLSPELRVSFGDLVKTSNYVANVDATLQPVNQMSRVSFNGCSSQLTPSAAGAASQSVPPQTYFTEQRIADMMRNLQQLGKSSSPSPLMLPEYQSLPSSTADSAALSPHKLHGGNGWGDLPSSRVMTAEQCEQQQQQQLAESLQSTRQFLQRVSHLEARISEMEADSGCRNGVFVLKLDAFTQRRLVDAREGKTTVIYSQSFCSHPQGYKFCLRVHPNGVSPPQSTTTTTTTRHGQSSSASGGGCFLSLFIHLMRGDYDDILEWPFRGRIVLSILDVSPSSYGQGQPSTARNGGPAAAARKRKDISAVVEETDPTLEAFARPQSSRNRRGFGYTDFALLDELFGIDRNIGNGTGGRTVPSSPYLVNDTLYIRASVQALT